MFRNKVIERAFGALPRKEVISIDSSDRNAANLPTFAQFEAPRTTAGLD
jgi:hypothetical protein